MSTLVAAAGAGGSALASWTGPVLLLSGFAIVNVALLVTGRSSPIVRRIPDNLERLTGIPGWAASTVGLALFGLLLAGQGFYSDVAWHVGLGRDDILFTSPHTSIFLGLQLILLSSAVCIWTATATKVDTPFRVGALRVPASAIPLGALGLAAVAGFPLDELWHQAYGIDVTMWSPTHMLMILGACFVGIASWTVLGEAKVRARGGWKRGLHVVAAVLTLQGLTAPLGEFAFGVPQFQQIFHPIIVSIAAGFALVAIRLVHGRWWGIGITTISFLLQANVMGTEGETGPVDTRSPALYIGSALLVELLARAIGTERVVRFAIATGVLVGTVGLATEWAWNAGAYQPWRASLLPDALVLSLIGAVGAALAGAAFARVVLKPAGDAPAERVPGRLVAAGAFAVFVVVALPLPRAVGDVDAALRVTPAGDGLANVEVSLTPPDAADDARWFQTTAWQGGGLVLADMEEVEPGVFRSEEPVPVAGGWKSVVRLHRGGELMAVPVFLPRDDEIGEPEISGNRSGPMESEKTYLLRETRAGNAWFAPIVHGLLLIAIAAWVAAFVIASRVIDGGRRGRGGRSVSRRVQPAGAPA
ncbi:MAG TPA: hypothetical protein VF230_06580 [Acidimicrobiales bacterium]